jgi:hypothetical protein
LNNGAYFAAPAVGSAIVVVATLLFAVVLFRTERT